MITVSKHAFATPSDFQLKRPDSGKSYLAFRKHKYNKSDSCVYDINKLYTLISCSFFTYFYRENCKYSVAILGKIFFYFEIFILFKLFNMS